MHPLAGDIAGDGRVLRLAGDLVDLVDVDDACLCLLYTSDAADERSSVDLGGRRIIKKKNMTLTHSGRTSSINTE